MRAEWHRTAVPSSIPELRAAVTSFATGAGVLDPPMADVRLAVTEAVTNAVVHGYRDAREPGMVQIVATHTGDRFDVVISDHGQGLTSRHDSPGMGLGLGLMAEVSDGFELRHLEPSGTEVQLSFALAAPAASDLL